MAKFLTLINNAGEFKGEDGTTRDYSNYTFHYADSVSDEDRIRNDEISSTSLRPFKVDKIPANKICQFMGVSEIPTCEIFNDFFGADIELIFGRTGVCGVKFININSATGEVTPRNILSELASFGDSPFVENSNSKKSDKDKSDKKA